MRLENVRKAVELEGIYESLSRKINSIAFDDQKLKSVEFNFGGPNVNLNFTDLELLKRLQDVALAYLTEQRADVERQVEEL